MKTGWQTKRLGDVCEIIKGRKPALKATPSDGDLPYLVARLMRGSEEAEYASVKDRNSITVEDSEAIIICDGSNSGEVFTGFRGILSSTMGKISKKAEIDDNYLRAFLASTFEVFNGAKTGAAIPHLDKEAMYQLEFPLPPLPEQQRIVGILDEAFDGIATAKANAEKNLQNARALFESHLHSVFTQRGEGWAEKRLGDVAELIDCLHKTPSYVESGFPMVRVTDIKPGVLDLSNTRKVDKKTFTEFSKKHTPNPGDIVFSRVGTYGVSSLVNSNETFCLGQNTVFIVPKINSLLLYHFLNSPNAKEQIDGFVDGTTQPTISLKSIREIRVAIPSLCDQQRLVAELDCVTSETGRLKGIYKRKLAALDALKKSLLHRAFSGQL